MQWLLPERERAYRACQPFRRVAYLGIRFWAGDQYADITEGVTNRWERRPMQMQGLSSVRKVDNQLIRVCRYAVANCAQSMPMMQVEAANTTPESRSRAAFASKILRWVHTLTMETELREQEILWLVGASECLRRSSYSPEGGDPGNPHADIHSEIVNPFVYMKDPHSIGKWPPVYIIEEDARHVDWIQQYYGKTVEPEALAETQQQLNSIATAVMTNMSQGPRDEMKGAALVTRLTVPRSLKHPKGRVWVFVGGRKPVFLEEHELQAGIFPYSYASWYPLPGRYRAMSLVEMVMHKQLELNHLISLLFEAAIQGVRGDIITSGMNTDIRPEVYDERTGARKIELGPGVEKFERISLAADWQQAEVRRQVITRGIMEDAGASEPSLGQMAKEDATAYEVQKVLEANASGLGWHLKRYADFHLTRVATTELQLLKEFVVKLRRVRARGGQGMDPEELVFLGADLEGADDVVAVPVPYMSPRMKQEATFQAHQSGLTRLDVPLEIQYANRKILRRMGLDEVEAEMAEATWPLEELGEMVREMVQLRAEAEAATIQAQTAAAEATAIQAAASSAMAESGQMPMQGQAAGQGVASAVPAG
jgi:hypothetical protein